MKNPFKNENVVFKSEEPMTPYQKSQREWDERIGAARVQARNWRLIAIFSAAISLLLLIVLLIEMATRHDKLFVAEVTQGGRVVNVAQLAARYQPTVAQEEYFIAYFIGLVRNLSLDPVVAKKNWLDAYNFLSQRGAERLNVFFRQNNPADLLGKKTISIKINSINPISDKTFEVDWVESTINANGQDEGQKNYTGVFTIAIEQPKTQKQILQNPLGIYIVDFSITPRTN